MTKRIALLIALLATMIFAENWSMPLYLVSGDRADTLTVTIGVDYRAGSGFDSGIDIAFPVPPPTGAYVYSAIDDSLHPGITMLGKDIRSAYSDYEEWVIHFERDLSGVFPIIFWYPEDVPVYDRGEDLAFADEIIIGAAYPFEEVSDWYDMTTIDELEFLNGQVVRIRANMSPEENAPPEVTSFVPDDGEVDVDLWQILDFTIVDDMTDVDLATMAVIVNGDEIPLYHLELVTVPFGYEVSYIPEDGWESGTEYCISIVAQDVSSPPAVMDTFHSCFTTVFDFEDEEPPYYERLSIEDGATDVFVFEHIVVDIKDRLSGVDSESIAVFVNGAPYTNMIISSIDGYPHNYRLDVIPPARGWNICELYHIRITACDLADVPNCSELLFSFTVTCEPTEEWSFRVKTWTAEDDDTVYNFLRFGVDAAATEMYDHGIDVPIGLPDFASYGYFPIDDPRFPLFRKLQDDIRSNASSITWRVEYHNPMDVCGIDWNITALYELQDLLGGYFRIGYGTREDRLLWSDMAHRNRLSFEPGNIVKIRYQFGSTDTTPPVVTRIRPDPDSIGYGMPDVSSIVIDIIDEESGVNAASIELYVNDARVDPSHITMSLLSRGFRVTYTPPTPLDYGVYDFEIRACDNNRTGANCGSHSWRYEFVSCLPEFGLDLRVFDLDYADDTLASATLRIGVAHDALVGRDRHDAPSFRPPSGTFFYFPIDDIAYDYLSADYRPNCDGEQLWNLRQDAVTGGFLSVTWNPDEVFEHDEWALGIAAGLIGEGVPDDGAFINMRNTGRFTYNASQMIYFKTMPYIAPTYCVSGSVVFCADDYTEAVVHLGDFEVILPPGGGEFEICNLHDGRYTVNIIAEGYEYASYDIHIDGDDVVLEEHEFCNLYNLYGSLSLDGEPMAYSLVSLDDMVDTTNVAGAFAFEDLIPGIYEICFSALGVCYPDTCFEVVLDSTIVLEFDYISPSYTVTGNIIYDSLPADGAEIYHCDSPGIVIATTDEFGNYRIADLSCGTHCFLVRYLDFPELDTAIFVSTDTIINYEYYGDYNYDISGYLSLTCGHSPHDALVSIGIDSVLVDSSGLFLFERVPRGDYTVRVTKPYIETIETLIVLEDDVDITIVAECLLPASGLTVVGGELVRPYLESAKFMQVSWTPPFTGLEVATYNIYRSESFFARVEDAVLIESTDSAIIIHDYDIEPDIDYFYGVEVIYDVHPYNSRLSNVASDVVTVQPDPNRMLLIDYDDGATPINGMGAEEAMMNLLTSPELGYGGGVTVTSQNPENLNGYDLDDYDAILIVLGIDDAFNPLMPESIVRQLLAFMRREGFIYVEGPDFGKLYREAGGVYTEFFRAFGIGWAASSDGYSESVGNVQNIEGSSSFFGSSIIAPYAYRTLADRSVDELRPVQGVAIITSTNDRKTRATVRIEDGNKRIASSIYLTAVQDFAAQVQIMGRYLEIDAIDESGILLPETYTMTVAPNPFNPVTAISIMIPQAEQISLDVYDVYGKQIANLFDGYMPEGTYSFDFDASGLASGVYFATINGQNTVRMIFVK